MDPALSSILVVLCCVLVAVTVGMAYLRWVRPERPPVGVYNGRDITIMTTALVVLPPLYTHLPTAIVAVVLGLINTVVLYTSIRPALPGRGATWALVFVLDAADITLAVTGGKEQDPVFLAVNDVVLVLLVVGVTNMWVQSGLRARQVAAFAALLAVYDLVATLALPVMVDFFGRVSVLPFSPALAWGHGSHGMALGLGDTVLVVAWTLVAEKAFGRAAAVGAGVLAVAGVVAVMAAVWTDLVNRPVPVMVVLGPLIVVQFLLLRRRYGPERSTAAYLSVTDGTPLPAEPVAVPARAVRAALDRAALDRVALDRVALDRAASDGVGGPVRYLAIRDGDVVASGATAGAAIRAAREAAGAGPTPLLVRVPTRGT